MDVIEVLHETGDGLYKCWSEQDEQIYTMRKSDLEYEASRGNEIIGEY